MTSADKAAFLTAYHNTFDLRGLVDTLNHAMENMPPNDCEHFRDALTSVRAAQRSLRLSRENAANHLDAETVAELRLLGWEIYPKSQLCT